MDKKFHLSSSSFKLCFLPMVAVVTYLILQSIKEANILIISEPIFISQLVQNSYRPVPIVKSQHGTQVYFESQKTWHLNAHILNIEYLLINNSLIGDKIDIFEVFFLAQYKQCFKKKYSLCTLLLDFYLDECKNSNGLTVLLIYICSAISFNSYDTL